MSIKTDTKIPGEFNLVPILQLCKKLSNFIHTRPAYPGTSQKQKIYFLKQRFHSKTEDFFHQNRGYQKKYLTFNVNEFA